MHVFVYPYIRGLYIIYNSATADTSSIYFNNHYTTYLNSREYGLLNELKI